MLLPTPFLQVFFSYPPNDRHVGPKHPLLNSFSEYTWWHLAKGWVVPAANHSSAVDTQPQRFGEGGQAREIVLWGKFHYYHLRLCLRENEVLNDYILCYNAFRAKTPWAPQKVYFHCTLRCELVSILVFYFST